MDADTKETFDMSNIPRIEAMAVLVALLLCVPDPAAAQENHRFQTRAKVWDMFWNYGTQGVSEDPDAWLSYYRQMGMQYPGVWTRQYSTEFQDYWGERSWGSLHPAYAALFESTATMPGFSTFIATRVPDDPEGEYYVSISKPRAITDDIRMMSYDASMGPEANIGYPNYSPIGPAMANWWPGESPVESRYVTEIHNYRYGHYMDPDKDNFPESLLIMRWTTKRGITVTKKVYTWSYPDYDDFQIMEYEFENTGDSDGDGAADLNGGAGLRLNDTFFAFSVRFFISQSGHGWMNYDAWYRRTRPTDNDDWFKFTEAANYDGPGAGLGMKMWYAYDGDNPLMPGDDIGKPYNPSTANPGYRGRPSQVRVPGELTAFQYTGFAPIAYLPSSSNDPGTFSYDTKGDNSYVAPRIEEQPHTVRWWEYRNRGDFDEPDQDNHSFQEIYDQLIGAESDIRDNPPVVGAWHGSIAYGPYDLAPGDKAKFVFVLAAAAPVEENIWGWAKQGKQAEMRTDKAFNNLVKHVDKAKEAFQWNYDLPDAPPDVKVDVGVTTEGFISLAWDDTADDAANPDYSGAEANDVLGYRVYRSLFKRDDWELMVEIPVKSDIFYSGGKYEFVDKKSIAGFLYDYSVRTYSAAHNDWNGTGLAIPSLESGNSSPEQWVNGVKVSTPYVPSTAQSDQLDRKVIVTPNPYRDDGAHAYENKGQIRFLNIPRKCQIRIYTVAGDLIAEVNHDDQGRGETTWSQTTIDNVGSASAGVYFYVVESLVDGTSGRTQRGIFLISK